MPNTHETEIPSDMAVLLWCILKGKQLYLPRLIRHQGRRAPTTTTEAATSSAVARPSAPPSTPSTPSIPAAPSSTSQPIYRLVQCLFEGIDQIEHCNKRHYQHLKRIIISGGTNIPPEPDTPSEHSDEEEA
ncbi:hypothetical protein AHAS_Ahas19G0296300 [Arachis hypogaea]